METKEQFQKILEWMKQINRSMASMASSMATKKDLLEIHLRIDGLDERFDSLSEAVQALLKGMRGLRMDQRSERAYFEKEIQKIRQEIRESMH